MFNNTLDYLGWGRGRLQGAGSSVIGVGEDLVPGDDSMGLNGRGERGRFLFLGYGGVWLMNPGSPRGTNGRGESGDRGVT